MKVTKRIKILRDILKHADISTVDRDIIESVIVGLELDIHRFVCETEVDGYVKGQSDGAQAGYIRGWIRGKELLG